MRKTFITLLALIPVLGAAYSLSNTAANKLRMAESAIANYYVDTINEDAIVEAGIKGMLKELDPHSSYSTAEETQEMNESLQGSFSGIGITYNTTTDTLYVIQTVSGGPSDKVGIMPGDRFLVVNDTLIAGVKMKNTDIRRRLRGPKGSKVDVKVLRGTDTIDFTIVRDIIPVYSVDVAYMVNPTTGYIRVNKYAKDTPKEVLDAMAKLRKQGMKDLILDITDNGGGYLNAAVELVSEFIEPSNLVVYTQGENVDRYNHYARPSGRTPAFGDGRLVLMVNQNTASAAEITSGAIQEWDRGVIVGRRTYGKGLVQRPFPFPDGSMMRLTIAHYYTPTGRNIQRPYTKGDRTEYDDDLSQRLKSGELMYEDSVKKDESLVKYTLKNNRPVYGGGGIYPDVFVGLDTAENTKYYRAVMAKGLLNRYAIKYIDGNRKQLKKQFRDAVAYVNGFEVNDKMINELVSMAEAEGIEPDTEQLNRSRKLFKEMIKALIGRDIFGEEAFYRVINSRDPIFIRAVEVINGPEYDELLKYRLKKIDNTSNTGDVIKTYMNQKANTAPEDDL